MQHLSHIKLLLKRLGIALLMFFVCRILFYIFNASYFSDFSPLIFLYGIRFDVSAICILFSPLILFHLLPFRFRGLPAYQVMLKWLFHLCNSTAIIFNCIDFEYFKFTLKRSTADLFQLVGMGDDFTTLLPVFLLDYWYVVLISILLILLSAYLYRKSNVRTISNPSGTFRGFLIQTVIMLFFTAVFVYAARGGFQLRPLNIINAGEYTPAKNIPLALNTPFTIIKTLAKQSLDEADFFEEAVAEQHFTPVQRFQSKGEFNDINVVIIILESFSKEYIGGLNDYEGYTPFLDSLMKKSLVFDRCYANGKKSMEAVPAIVAGLPTLMNNPYISSHYSGNHINSLASILKEKGYRTSFFHGGTNGTMGFDAFTNAAGFDAYFGREEYGNEADYDGNWGIYDEEFFRFFAEKLDETTQPFFSCFFSLSSHHPYSVPEKYAGKFKKGKLKIYQPIQYTDYSLKRFFEIASKMPWFDRTLFVITADHTANAILPEYKTSEGMYAIPLLIYAQDSNMTGINHQVTQQTDIMPSVLEYMNYDGSFVAFGQSFFSNKEGYSVSFINNVYQLITTNYLLHFDGYESIALYDLKNDMLLNNNILNTERETVQMLENKLKAIIQSYNQRMIHNQMHAER